MNLPIVLLCGQAGVGKDTIAGIIKNKYGFQTMAQADPIKDIGLEFFAFTKEELWGPSENRNKVVPLAILVWRANQAMIQEANNKPAAVYSRFSPHSFPALQMSPAHILLAQRIEELRGPGVAPAYAAAVNACDRFMNSLKQFIEEKGGLSARVVLQLLGTEVGRAVDQLIWTRATFNKAKAAVATGSPGVTISDGRFRSEVLTAKEAGGKVVFIRGATVETVGAVQHASETEILTVPQHFFDLVIENDKTLGAETLEKAFDLAFAALFPTIVFKGYSQGEDAVYYLDDPRQE